ncbi:hypothetical protein AC249_AIPGENE13164 [Exaiptasia diaphana]|nr:hypothetical protein AC249_AIPGENE13164 [Exaiptasia diaphana]
MYRENEMPIAQWRQLTIVAATGSPRGKGENLKTHTRFRRSVAKNIDIYTLDHFIGLIEKIERHQLAKNKPLKVIANYIRKLSYNDNKWTTLLGKQSDSLPDGILTPQEKAVLTNMVNHRFLGQQEQGVVHTPFGDVAMGRVITGICQLLRMYYQNGVVYNKFYAACKRQRIFNAIVMESQLTRQVTLAAYAIKTVWNDGVDFSTVSNSEIPGISQTTIQKFYTHIENLRGYKCPDGNDDDNPYNKRVSDNGRKELKRESNCP